MKLYTYWRSLATFRVRMALNLKGLEYESVMSISSGAAEQARDKAVNPQMVIPSLSRTTAMSSTSPWPSWSTSTRSIRSRRCCLPMRRGRARLALSLITVADSHPLIVPRVRNHLAATIQSRRRGQDDWVRPGSPPASMRTRRISHAKRKPAGTATRPVDDGRLCLVSHAAGYRCSRATSTSTDREALVDTCMEDERIAARSPCASPCAGRTLRCTCHSGSRPHIRGCPRSID